MRNLKNLHAHRFPAFVDALQLIEKLVTSVDEQEKLLENPFLVTKSSTTDTSPFWVCEEC